MKNTVRLFNWRDTFTFKGTLSRRHFWVVMGRLYLAFYAYLGLIWLWNVIFPTEKSYLIADMAADHESISFFEGLNGLVFAFLLGSMAMIYVRRARNITKIPILPFFAVLQPMTLLFVVEALFFQPNILLKLIEHGNLAWLCLIEIYVFLVFAIDFLLITHPGEVIKQKHTSPARILGYAFIAHTMLFYGWAGYNYGVELFSMSHL